jgi:threonine-phosphate decarboxylase
MIIGHGGNIFDAAAQIGCRPTDIIDMSSNINPLGPMKTLVDHLSSRFHTVTRLPDVDARRAVELFAAVHRLKHGNVLAGNGSTEFIYSLPQALTPRKVLILGPTYADYADACSRQGLHVAHRLSAEENEFLPDLQWLQRHAGGFDTVFICNPNNPTGVLIRGEEIAALCRRHPGTCFVVDESYLLFVPDGRHHSLANHLPQNAVVLHSLSKIFRIPGLRVGFLIAAESLVERFRPWMLPWNVNGLAQAAVEFLMQQHREIEAFVGRSSDYVRREREKLFQVLKSRTRAVPYPSETVFFLVRLPDGKTASEVKAALLRHRLLIRDCSNFEGLSQRYIRISVKTTESNQLLAERLTAELNR